MPELPEVETVKRGLAPYLEGMIIHSIDIRNPNLRWPISDDLDKRVGLQPIMKVSRRGKYLLVHLAQGTLIIHLGMSGSLRLVQANKPILKHDHVDIHLSSGQTLRYNDPRRFGAILWAENDGYQHPLLHTIGIEPLDESFTSKYLKKLLTKRQMPIKSFLMNAKIIAGIGNIYAAEALFLSGIHPQLPANKLSNKQCEALVAAIKTVLENAINSGGTTLRDFVNSDGKPGYFAQQLYVYGRAGQACRVCSSVLAPLSFGQRSTVFCPRCQHE